MDFDNTSNNFNFNFNDNNNCLIDEDNKDILKFYNQNPNGLITKKQLKLNLKELISDDDELIENIISNIPFEKVAPIKFIYDGFLKEYSKINNSNKDEEFSNEIEDNLDHNSNSNFKTSIIVSSNDFNQISEDSHIIQNNMNLNISNEIKNYIEKENELIENNLLLDQKISKLKLQVKQLKESEKKKKHLENQYEQLVQNEIIYKKQINDLRNQIQNLNKRINSEKEENLKIKNENIKLSQDLNNNNITNIKNIELINKYKNEIQKQQNHLSQLIEQNNNINNSNNNNNNKESNEMKLNEIINSLNNQNDQLKLLISNQNESINQLTLDNQNLNILSNQKLDDHLTVFEKLTEEYGELFDFINNNLYKKQPHLLSQNQQQSPQLQQNKEENKKNQKIIIKDNEIKLKIEYYKLKLSNYKQLLINKKLKLNSYISKTSITTKQSLNQLKISSIHFIFIIIGYLISMFLIYKIFSK